MSTLLEALNDDVLTAEFTICQKFLRKAAESQTILKKKYSDEMKEAEHGTIDYEIALSKFSEANNRAYSLISAINLLNSLYN
jgi:hypothetical protein